MMFRRLILSLVFVVLLPFLAFADGQRVILVMDASGSMRGKINGQTKMAIAKEVVAKVVGSWKPEDELGLVVYGHRDKNSCDDIETVIEPGKLDSSDFISKVEGLLPKGKTPMTQAVLQAADALRYQDKPATVILVSDGIENCNLDPCEVAAQLEKEGINLTVHTVGFGLDDEGAINQLKCIAEKTGGSFYTASNADELQTALNKTVAAPVEEEPPQPVLPEYNVLGHVIMAPGVELAKPFLDPYWEIYPSVNGQKGERITTEYGVDIKYNMAQSGDYIIRIVGDGSNADIYSEFPVRIDAGQVNQLNYSLDMGVVKLTAYFDETTPVADSSLYWQFEKPTGDLLATKYGPEVTFLLPGGTPKVHITFGTIKAEADVKVAVGQYLEQVVSLGAGTIEVTGLYSEGGEAIPAGSAIELRKGQASLDGKHEWIATEYNMPSIFKTLAGKYQIVIIKDYAQKTFDVELKPGQALKFSGSIDAGFLAIPGPEGSTFEIYGANKDISGKRERIATEYGALNKAFTAGKYVVKLIESNGEVLGEKEYEVKAGVRTEGSIP
jgi:Ca-activated chloride channel homolog